MTLDHGGDEWLLAGKILIEQVGASGAASACDYSACDCLREGVTVVTGRAASTGWRCKPEGQACPRAFPQVS